MRAYSFNKFIYNYVEKYNDKLAFRYRPEHILELNQNTKYIDKSFKDFFEDILKLKLFFEKNNIDKKHIALFGRNSYPWSLIMSTVEVTDNILVPLDKELQYNETINCLERAKVDIIFYDSKFEKHILEVNKKTNLKIYSFDEIKEYIFSENKEFNYEEELKKYINEMNILEEKFEEYEKVNGFEAIKDKPKDCIKDSTSLEDVKVLLFTSGTTSASKLVILTRENLLTNTYDINEHVPFKENLTEIALIPSHHIFGLNCINVVKNAGITTTYPDSLKQLSNNFVEYEISMFVGVPLILEAIYDRIKKTAIKTKKWNKLNFARKLSNFLLFFGIDKRRKLFAQVLKPLGGCLNTVISGAAPINDEVASFFKDIGVDIFPGYGLSETSPVVSAESYIYHKKNSVGKPVEHIEVKIDNESLVNHYKETLDLNNPKNLKIIEDVKNSNEGEILIKGKSVFRGYYNDVEKTKDSFTEDNWFRSGDIGYFDKDGFLFITGRIKDMIVLPNGKKAFPDELEYLLNSIDGVQESFVFGTDENIGYGTNGEIKIYAKLVYDPNNKEFKDKTIDQIKDILWEKVKKINDTIPSYKYIRGIVLSTETLTKTSSHKIKRFIEKDKTIKENITL